MGEVYIGLDAGGDTQMLADGGVLTKTQSAVVLEKLIGPVFSHIGKTFIDAFVKRAETVYRPNAT